MRAVSDKLLELDNTEWFSELFDDRRNVKMEINLGHIDYIRTLLKLNNTSK
jgi:hypothetical protein